MKNLPGLVKEFSEIAYQHHQRTSTTTDQPDEVETDDQLILEESQILHDLIDLVQDEEDEGAADDGDYLVDDVHSHDI